MNPFRLLQSLLNRLLPFTRPGTPLLQDLVHTAALCAFLYFAPAIFENRSAPQTHAGGPLPDHAAPPDATQAPRTPGDFPAEHEAHDAFDEQLEEEQLAAFDEEDADAAEAELLDGDADADADADADLGFDANGDADALAGAGPANPEAAAARRRAQQATRQVGAKKARSIQRRDQRRAYHEFVRSQAEAQRAREAEGQEEREAELFEEKRRRAVAEAALEEKARREREERRERERRQREDELRVQQEALRLVRAALDERRAVQVRDVAEAVGRSGLEGKEWLERLLRADGVVGKGRGRDGCVRMITAGNWVVRVDETDMQAAWKRVAQLQAPKITYADLGRALEDVVLQRA